jgi:hypothetical protein
MSINQKLSIAAILGASFFATGAPMVSAATLEKEGVRLDLIQKTLSRNDGPKQYDWKDIDRLLAIKVTIKNTGFNPLPAAKLNYALLVRRWGTMETGSVERIEGTESIEALERGQSLEKMIGEYRIGGHLHGTNKRHLDTFEEWQITLDFGDRQVSFESSSKFALLNKLANKSATSTKSNQ